MPISFVTDVKEGETDILSGYENKVLSIIDLDGKPIIDVTPASGPWNHARLCEIGVKLELLGLTQEGAEAYLEDQWVGSTEV